MSELMATLEFVRTYLDDLLCISKGNLEDHLTKLRRVFIRLRDAGLTVNAPQVAFLCHGDRIPRICAIQRWYKTTTKKVQAILALTPPQNVKQLRRFLGMVQYYRDIWARRSEILAPLTNLVVYRWRLLLEEYGPTIVYIKGIHNTVVDAISRLDYGPVPDDRSTWMTFAQCWCYHNTSQPETSLASTQESMNQVFANRNEEDSIYPLTTREIAEAQQQDESLLNKGYSTQLYSVRRAKWLFQQASNTAAVAWFHHYLQHPGTKRLEETLRLSMYWKGLRTTVQSHVKKCHSCQVNKRRQIKYGNCQQNLPSPTPGRLYVWTL
eukprot:CCRYP_010563-RA/>CCRYP_010563-RA protein AED:0.41 eAED:0.58 QI:0/0/0/1/0/0/3/0/322